MNDQSQRFIFENADIRGELVHLQHSLQQVTTHHHYPKPVAALLGEFMAAAALLSSTIKFNGTLTLQARSDKGEIPLIMAEASSQQTVRAIARNAEQASSTDFQQLLAGGLLSITIDPTNGKRYQGVVSLEADSFARCLELYFEHSEQLSTRIWLASDGASASGMLLQELPASEQVNEDARENAWQHVSQLASTLSREELLQLDFATLLHRLYHQDPLRLFEAKSWAFKCSCNRNKTLDALLTVGRSGLEETLNEEGQILITCEFCHQQYRYDDADIKQLFEQSIH